MSSVVEIFVSKPKVSIGVMVTFTFPSEIIAEAERSGNKIDAIKLLRAHAKEADALPAIYQLGPMKELVESLMDRGVIVFEASTGQAR